MKLKQHIKSLVANLHSLVNSDRAAELQQQVLEQRLQAVQSRIAGLDEEWEGYYQNEKERCLEALRAVQKQSNEGLLQLQLRKAETLAKLQYELSLTKLDMGENK